MSAKKLYVAWQDPGSRRWSVVGVLERGTEGFLFCYTRGAEDAAVSFLGMHGDLARCPSPELPPFFANRLLNRGRPEYEQVIAWLGFGGVGEPDPMEMLAVSGGERATDNLALFPEPVPVDGVTTLKFFVHGLRHRGEEALAQVGRLVVGQPLSLRHEDDNLVDSYAVVVEVGGTKLPVGHCPRYYAPALKRAIEEGRTVTASVAQVNPDAPVQLRLMCQVEVDGDDFRCCDGREYETVCDNVANDSGVGRAP